MIQSLYINCSLLRIVKFHVLNDVENQEKKKGQAINFTTEQIGKAVLQGYRENGMAWILNINEKSEQKVMA